MLMAEEVLYLSIWSESIFWACADSWEGYSLGTTHDKAAFSEVPCRATHRHACHPLIVTTTAVHTLQHSVSAV